MRLREIKSELKKNKFDFTLTKEGRTYRSGQCNLYEFIDDIYKIKKNYYCVEISFELDFEAKFRTSAENLEKDLFLIILSFYSTNGFRVQMNTRLGLLDSDISPLQKKVELIGAEIIYKQ